jgi:toxin FitB
VKLLLDTCVLSELRHPQGSPVVREAILRRSDEDLFISVLTLGEIRKGIVLHDDANKRRFLTAWLDGLPQQFPNRVLPVDHEAALIWGEIDAAARKKKETVPAVDGLIAATAIRHGLAVATRNTGHFDRAGARIFNPWAS